MVRSARATATDSEIVTVEIHLPPTEETDRAFAMIALMREAPVGKSRVRSGVRTWLRRRITEDEARANCAAVVDAVRAHPRCAVGQTLYWYETLSRKEPKL